MSLSPGSASSGIGTEENEEELVAEVLENSAVPTKTESDLYPTADDDILNASTQEELEKAVELCKNLIITTSDESIERKKGLVRRLIELRLRLFEVKQQEEDNSILENVAMKKVLLGHHFVLQNIPNSTAKYYCDRCSRIIWNVIHTWYLCLDCDYKCHITCINQVCRLCAHVLVSENPKYLLKICPEPTKGLAEQNYRCAECLTHTSFRETVLEPRRCDYNGKYYCPTCHWNSLMAIPARVILNWDFSERRVCRSTKQMLQLMSKLPVIRLEKINPMLFASVDELRVVKGFRQRLNQMKKYLTSCRVALETKLLWQVTERVHFVEDCERYSMADLIDLKNGRLIAELGKIENALGQHITVDCEICCGRGFICELCNSAKVIFPFEPDVETCPKCEAAYHFICWLQSGEKCKKCYRRQKREETVGNS